jgi:uncharacterized membrane protein
VKPSTVAMVVFALIALAHLIRIALGWDVTVNGTFIPQWVSVIACMVAAVLAFILWREPRR